MTRHLIASLLCSLSAVTLPAQDAPRADHHQHLFSPALVSLIGAPAGGPLSITARDVLALLDSAGIHRGVALSAAYMYGAASRTVDDEYAKVRAENDWNAAQVAPFPDRLRVFCSFNPLKEYALTELARCAKDANLRVGIKLHLGNGDVLIDDPGHLAQLRKVFKAANDNRMAIVVHSRASISRQRPYGAAQAKVFLEQLLPMAPDVAVQIAHLAGTGPGYQDPPADSALAVFVEAIARKDPRMSNVWFDVTSSVNADITPATAALVVKRIRQLGIDRILYGTDAAFGNNLRPRESWAAFRRIPLTDDEFRRIAGNVAPYLRW